MNLNKVIILGRLTQNPDLRSTSSGTPVCSFGVATNRVWRDRDSGEQQRSTEFHNVVAWRRLAEISSNYLNKGDLVLIEGRLRTRSWENSSGSERRRTEIIADNVQLPPKSMSRKRKTRPTRKPEKKGKEKDIPVIEEDKMGEKKEENNQSGNNEEDINVEDIPF